MNEPSLENLLRSLRPAELPADLAARVATPPPAAPARNILRPWRFALAALTAAACVALVAILPDPAAGPGRAANHAATRPLSIHQHESTLLDERPLAVVEHDGRLWQIAERQWQDRDLALCSATPLRVQLATTRREIVCQPVHFD